MAKQIDAGGVVLEDLEWKDSQGRSWFIAGDIDVEIVVEFLSEWQEVDSADDLSAMTGFVKNIKKLFATRHSEEELKELKIPAARLIPIATGIVNALMGDMEDAVKQANPTTPPRAQRRQAAREQAKNQKKAANG